MIELTEKEFSQIERFIASNGEIAIEKRLVKKIFHEVAGMEMPSFIGKGCGSYGNLGMLGFKWMLMGLLTNYQLKDEEALEKPPVGISLNSYLREKNKI